MTAAALAALALLAADPGWVTHSAELMATRIDATLPSGADPAPVFAAFRDVDTRMSEWRDTSPLSAVNKAAGGDPVPVPADLRAVVSRGVELGGRTSGAFDITWAALWGLWDFKAKSPRPPSPAEISTRIARVDYRQVEVDDAAGTVRLARPGMLIGLGGIAKGYALERAAAALRAKGLEDFMLSAGGQVYAAGDKGARPWRVGIRDPRGPADDWFAVVEVRDESVSTSGDYERFFVHEGTRYHHILDPRTGWPSKGLRSATVVAADPTLADALSTALMVLGRNAAVALVEDWPGVACVLVDAQGRVVVTGGLEGRLTVRHRPKP